VYLQGLRGALDVYGAVQRAQIDSRGLLEPALGAES
jgi:hypothetical protein